MSAPPESKPRLSGEFHPTKLIEYRVALVGRTGEGKSATGNTIFGSKVFKSGAYAKSETQKCQSVKDTVFGRNLVVVDTPGFFDTERSHEETETEILTFLALTSPGPHIILLVMKIQRCTKELQVTYERLCSLLRNKGQPYTIIVFTGGDDLDEDGITIDQYVQGATVGVKKMLVESGNRYVVFNNRLKGKQREDQVNKLIKKIDALVEANEGGVLSSELYDNAEEALSMKEVDERDALLKKTEAEKSKLKERLREKQKEIESFHLDRMQSLRVKGQLQHRNEQMIQMEREYLQKIAKSEQENEAKFKSLEDQYQMELVHVRDETRQKINKLKIKVSDPWFKTKLKRFLKI